MKRIFFCIILACILIQNALTQNWVSGINKLYTYPDTTKVGIGISAPSERLHINKGALKIGNTTSASDRSESLLKFGDGSYVQIGEWEADDMLSFKANKYNFTNGNLGIGVTAPQYKLDVNGTMLLRATETINGYAVSHLKWNGHKLVMGTPSGIYAYNIMELKPGGCTQDSLSSQLTMYTAYSPTDHVARIQLNTFGPCWINTFGNFGIGTDNPLYKLDVRGTIRADEILVNNVSGADFVFENDYNLRPLSEVQTYIQEYNHLPEIPSAAEMQANGINMSELQIQLLQKVEELTLYILQQEKRIKELESCLTK